MRQTSTAPLIGWSRSFPATPEQAGKARRFLAAILDGHPADDAILCLSELVTNATIHSRSQQPGGRLTVHVQRRGDHVRVEVCDQGGPWTETAHEDGQTGPWLTHRRAAGPQLGTNGKRGNRLGHLVRAGVPVTVSAPPARWRRLPGCWSRRPRSGPAEGSQDRRLRADYYHA